MDKRTRDPSSNSAERRYADFKPSPAPIGPGGSLMPDLGAVGQPAEVPAFDEEHVVCVRGPCRHYWHLVTTVGEGNPASTWEALGRDPPRQHSHTCLANPGMETEFEDDAVYECNRWDPYTDAELAARDERRQLYQIRSRAEAPVERVEDAVDDDGDDDDKETP